MALASDPIAISQTQALYTAITALLVGLLGFLGTWLTVRASRRATENERKLNLFEEQDRLLEQNRTDADRARREREEMRADRDRARGQRDEALGERDEWRRRALHAERQVTEWLENRETP